MRMERPIIEESQVRARDVSNALRAKREGQLEQYQELFQGDVWELRDAEGAFVEAYAIDTIDRHGTELQVVTKTLGPDLLVREGAAVAEEIIESRSDERLIEDFRKELQADGYRRVKQGGVSERTFKVEQREAVSILLPKIPGESVTFFRQTQFFDDREYGNGTERLVVECVESPATPLYVFIDSSLSSTDEEKLDKRYYTAREVEKKIREEGWTLSGETLSNVEAIPELFTEALDAKRKEKRFWTRESLLSEVLPGETSVIKNTQFGGGERSYKRVGNELVSALNGKSETENVAWRLNHGWELVEKPGDDVLAGAERAQFLSDKGSPEGALLTVEKRNDGNYYILQNEDEWVGPLTKGRVRARKQAEQWEKVVEINSLKDFLEKGGPEAAETIRAYEKILRSQRERLRQKLQPVMDDAASSRVVFMTAWHEKVLPHIKQMLAEDLEEKHGVLELPAKKVIQEVIEEI